MGYRLNKSIMLSELSEALGLKTYGSDISVTSVSPAHSAGPGDLTFSKTEDIKLESAAVITSVEPVDHAYEGCGFINSKNPRLDFIRALSFVDRSIGFSTWEEESEIHPTAVIGKNVVIESGCVVGENTIIEHNVVIHSGTRIGKNSRIRSCSSIGGDGFGFERLEDGAPLRFPHLGGVQIGDNVEIGACTAVARGTLSDTIIHDHVKIDNLVHIAHNCEIKKGAFIIACAELSGGAIIGENAWVAPNSCTREKVNIGAGALVGLGSVVTKDVPDGCVFAGNPAKKIRDI